MKKTPKYLNRWSRKDFLRLPQEFPTHHYTSLIIFPIKEKCMDFWIRYALIGCIEGVPTGIQYCEEVVWSCSGVLIDCLRKSKAFRFWRNLERPEDLDKTFHITRSDNNIKIELF